MTFKWILKRGTKKTPYVIYESWIDKNIWFYKLRHPHLITTMQKNVESIWSRGVDQMFRLQIAWSVTLSEEVLSIVIEVWNWIYNEMWSLNCTKFNLNDMTLCQRKKGQKTSSQYP